jgi:ATPase subunit of ABC transporter with duplicated ATPase domains
MAQADKMRAKATKTVAAQNMARRAERLLSGLEEVRVADRLAKVRFPKPAPCGKTPLTASGLSKSYGSLEIFTDVDVAVDRVPGWPSSASTGPERPRCCGSWPGCCSRTPARCARVTGCGSATTPRNTRPWTWTVRCWSTCAARPPTRPTPTCARFLGAFLFSGDDVEQAGRRAVRRREDPARAGDAGLLGRERAVLDEPTNNLDPASREQVLEPSQLSRAPSCS